VGERLNISLRAATIAHPCNDALEPADERAAPAGAMCEVIFEALWCLADAA
jgi:hypothetical protein